MISEIRKSTIIAIWFSILSFPLIVLKVDYIEKSIHFRWKNLVLIAIVTFFVSIVWRYFLERMEKTRKEEAAGGKADDQKVTDISLGQRFLDLLSRLTQSKPLIAVLMVVVIAFPFSSSTYQTSILISAMMYIVLGLGLNIVVGMAGLLDLGYGAFYLIGGYTFALLNIHTGAGFWISLPIAGLLAASFGVLLGIPVLRLRGDYLAIVTLGFHEIVRLVVENWDEVLHGPSGIPNIPKPGLFGFKLGFNGSTIYLYYITVLIMLVAIGVIRRLHISRIGRAWMALREDETACQAMGIDTTMTKLTAFGLGAFWAGIVGVIFAAKASFVNPASFTFYESAMILSIVVLGGMGSIRGVILATLILILLPEYMRFLKEYRILFFGAIMVVMMVFRPQGLISDVHHKYELETDSKAPESEPAQAGS